MRDQYIIGRSVTEEVRLFAFPRVGSHYLAHCLNGLYDLIVFPHPHQHNPEAIARQDEVELPALYALDLREEGSPHCPLYLNALSTGEHGLPVRDDHRRIVLVRHPLPTLYSFFRVNRDRWGAPGDLDPTAWLEGELARYLAFYEAAHRVRGEDPAGTHWVRYEELVAGPEALRKIVEFVGRRPKLAPEFVHWVTHFERFARPAGRTFYREARAGAYRDDPVWRALAAGLDSARWEFLGYGPRPD